MIMAIKVFLVFCFAFAFCLSMFILFVISIKLIERYDSLFDGIVNKIYLFFNKK